MDSVAKYVKKIKKNDPHLTQIHLSKKALTDSDIKPLLDAFAQHPEAARRITVIILSRNMLSKFCGSGFTALKKLNLSQNSITQIELGELPAIEKIYLSNNDLQYFSTHYMPNLKILSLINNSCLSINLSDSPQLELVSLYGNMLSKIAIIALHYYSVANPSVRIQMARYTTIPPELPHQRSRLSLHRIEQHMHYILNDYLQTTECLNWQKNLLSLLKIYNSKVNSDIIVKVSEMLLPNPILSRLKFEINMLKYVFVKSIDTSNEVQLFNKNIVAMYLKSNNYKILWQQASNAVASLTNRYVLFLTAQATQLNKDDKNVANKSTPTSAKMRALI